MADDNELIVGVGANTDPLKKGLAEAGKEVDEFGKKVDDASKKEVVAADDTENLSGTLSDLGGVLEQAGGKLGKAGTQIKKMSAGAGQAAASIGSMGAASGAAIVALAGIGTVLAIGAIAIYKNKDAILQYVAGINDLTRAFDEAAPAIGKQIGKLTQLVDAYDDANTSEADKVRIMEKLQKEYPTYFGNLKTEGEAVDNVKKAYDLQKESIIGLGIIKALEAKKAPLYAKIAELGLRTELTLIDKIGLALTGLAAGTPVAGIIGEALLGDGVGDLEADIAKIDEIIKKVDSDYKVDIAEKLGLKDIKKNIPPAAETAEAIKGYYTEVGTLLSEIQIPPLPPLINPVALTLEQTQLNEHLATMKQALIDFNTGASEIINSGIANTFGAIGQVIGEGLASGGISMKAMGGVLLEGVASIIGQLGELAIETGVGLLAIQLALKTLNPFVAIAAGIALVALASFIGAKAAAIGSGGGASASGGGSSGGRASGVGSTVGGASQSNYGGSSVQRSSSGSSGGGTYVFEIAGTKLIGVLKNTIDRNQALGGSNLTFG